MTRNNWKLHLDPATGATVWGPEPEQFDDVCLNCGELVTKKGFADETFFFCETCGHFLPDDEVRKVPFSF